MQAKIAVRLYYQCRSCKDIFSENLCASTAVDYKALVTSVQNSLYTSKVVPHCGCRGFLAHTIFDDYTGVADYIGAEVIPWKGEEE